MYSENFSGFSSELADSQVAIAVADGRAPFATEARRALN